MTSFDPRSHYPLLRPLALALGILALLTAATGVLSALTVLGWAVAVIALAVFAASFYLKSGL